MFVFNYNMNLKLIIIAIKDAQILEFKQTHV
jgi:hypothetical protein